MWFELRGKAESLSRAPEVFAERCVHNIPVLASCRKCIDICPPQAWILTDENLILDVAQCDGCSLCVAVCPEEAIVPPVISLTGFDRGVRVAMAACEKSAVKGDSERNGVISCIHALGIRELLNLYRRGFSHLLIARGDCSECLRGKEPLFDQLLDQLNASLISRGLNVISCEFAAEKEWLQRRGRMESNPGPEMSRRDFFRRGFGQAVDKTFEIAKVDPDDEVAEHLLAPGQMLPEIQFGQIAIYLPQIDTARCDGCDACVRLCPRDALRLERSGNDGGSYEIFPDDCTGCSICIDVCDQDAIQVHHWSACSDASIDLDFARCRACGVEFHRPVVRDEIEKMELCRICAHSNHHKNLFQVLD